MNIAGAILTFFGIIWFLQGIGILPGSFMTGQTRWAVYGGIATVVGIALLLMANRRRRNPETKGAGSPKIQAIR